MFLLLSFHSFVLRFSTRGKSATASLRIFIHCDYKKKQKNENRIDKKEEGAFNTPDDDILDNRKKMVSR